MVNILLGRTLKAMYKLSGKTLPQLADESGLSIDTVNNLFYARIQKPGLIGVSALTKAMGFSVQTLMGFLEQVAPSLAEETDFTEAFTQYIASAADTVPLAAATGVQGDPTAAPADADELYSRRLEQYYQTSLADMRAAHARQLERIDFAARECRRRNLILGILLTLETVAFFVFAFLH